MAKEMRLLLALVVFFVVAGATLAAMLAFIPPLDEGSNDDLMVLGLLGAILWVVYYGPMLLVSVGLGVAFARFTYANLPGAP